MAESITNGRRVYTEVSVAGQKCVAAEYEPDRASPADWAGEEATSNFAGGARACASEYAELKEDAHVLGEIGLPRDDAAVLPGAALLFAIVLAVIVMRS